MPSCSSSAWNCTMLCCANNQAASMDHIFTRNATACFRFVSYPNFVCKTSGQYHVQSHKLYGATDINTIYFWLAYFDSMYLMHKQTTLFKHLRRQASLHPCSTRYSVTWILVIWSKRKLRSSNLMARTQKRLKLLFYAAKYNVIPSRNWRVGRNRSP